MNYGLIFAGGTGVRMNAKSKPKQFLELHGKPIIIYTLEHFERHSEVDSYVVVCLGDWIEELEKQIKRYELKKVYGIVEGGQTGHESIYNGLRKLSEMAVEDDIVLIHDGVRPLITPKLISDNIECAKLNDTAITVEPLRESVVECLKHGQITDVPNRSEMFIARAPQTFKFKLIWNLHQKAEHKGLLTTDSTHLCQLFNINMSAVPSSPNNIKITEPYDYYIFRALYEVIENQQIIGI